MVDETPMQNFLDTEEINLRSHVFSDVDVSDQSQHHTLGTSPNQAARGSHRHDTLYDSIGSAAGRMRWASYYTTPGFHYDLNDVVKDGPWTTICVNPDGSSDPPSPQPSGSPFDVYAGLDPTTSGTAKTLGFGTRYNFPETAEVISYRVYMVAGNEYSVWLAQDPLGDNVVTELISGFTANETGWQTFSINGTIVSGGTDFEIVAFVKEPDSTPTTWTGDWNYTTPPNSGAPSGGVVIHSNGSPGLFQISKTDNVGGDRSAELAALAVGDTIDALGDSWAIQTITDRGTYFDFGVAPAVQAFPDGVTTFTFITETATPITYLWDQFYWDTSPYAANVWGLWSLDGGPLNVSRDAFGVDIQVQKISLSSDWEIVAYSAGGGGGGGGELIPHDHIRPWYETVISGAVSIKASTYVDMPGTLITFDLAEQSTIEVTGQFDFRFTQGTLGSRVLIGIAAVDGVDQSQVQALLQLDGEFGRLTIPLPKRRYVLEAGTHTVVLRARSTNTTGTAGIIEVSGHTNLIVEVI